MADMVSAGLPKSIKFTPIAKIDNTLAGVPGNEITIPAWGYIGDAEDIAEGVEVSATQMSTSVAKAKIKKSNETRWYHETKLSYPVMVTQ